MNLSLSLSLSLSLVSGCASHLPIEAQEILTLKQDRSDSLELLAILGLLAENISTLGYFQPVLSAHSVGIPLCQQPRGLYMHARVPILNWLPGLDQLLLR
jgi:hypothetical protein